LLGALFFENLVRLAGPSAVREGKIHLPLGDGSGVVPAVAAMDVAKVAAGILADPAVHRGKSYYVIGLIYSPFTRSQFPSPTSGPGRGVRSIPRLCWFKVK
jgi:uncharacterized protein YbjT (DUF2867 family)